MDDILTVYDKMSTHIDTTLIRRTEKEKRPCSGMLQGRSEYGTAQRDF
jgi:hypothetical protein